MATATTSAQTIREDRRDAIEDIRPGQHRQVRMREYKRNGDFRAWAESKPAACFRRFQVRDLVTYEAPTISDVLTEEVKTQFEIVVAYPANGQFGSDVINGLEDAIRADQILLETALGAVAHGDYPSGCNLFQLASVDIEREEDVYFLVTVYDVVFKRDVTLDVLDLNASASITSAATVAAVATLINNFQSVANVTATATATAAGSIDYSQVGAISASATVTAAGTFVAGGPTLLSDFDFSTPATVGIGGNGTFASANADEEWLLQETSGTHANNAGTETLSVGSGMLQGQTAVGLWDGSSYVARNAVETTADTDYLVSSGTSALDSASTDFAIRVVFRATGTPAGTRHFFTKRNGAAAGWSLGLTVTGQPEITVEDSSANTTNTKIAADHCDGAWHCVSVHFVDSDTVYIKSDLGSASTSVTSIGSITNSVGVRIGDPTVYSTYAGIQVTYAGGADAANASAFYGEAVVLPGTDPTALLTTQTRASLISVPVSATQVAHFTDDTLPIGFNSNFTSGYGLYCNSAVTNLITESESLSNWTSSNMTETDNFGDAPDGFRSATKLAATAGNGYSAETFTTVAATEYTLSCYVREITVGCTGRVIFYDETGAAELASQVFTCTSANQLVSVTATTNAGQVSSSMRIEIDTNTEECYAWGCQANLGRGRGAYIRSSGSSSALVATHFEANAAAGTLTTSITGESESIFVQGRDDGITRYVYHNQTTSNQNRHWLRLDASLNVKSHIYDSSGSYVDDLTAASTKDFDAQENTVVNRWDSAGTLAVGGGVGFSTKWNSDSAATGVVTWTATDNLQDVEIGSVSSGNGNLDGFVQRVRFWDGERS